LSVQENIADKTWPRADGTRPAIYYGWWVLAAVALTEMLSVGSASYAAGLFVLPLEREFSLSRTAASSALPISFAGAAVMAPLVGYLLDHYPAQRMIAIGALAFGIGFAVISATSSLMLMVLILLIPAAFGGLAIGPLATVTITSRWFYRRRGRALGFATVATSGAGIVVVPLLSWAIETFGWRKALFGESVLITSIILALAIFVIRNAPYELGLANHPENKGRPQSDIPVTFRADGALPVHRSYREILSSWNFWSCGLVLAAISGIDQALVVTIVPYATGLGLASMRIGFGFGSVSAPVLLISGFAVTAASVKILTGILADHIDRRVIIVAATFLTLVSLCLFLWFSGYAFLLLASCLAGAGLGCILPSSAALIAASFGAPSFGRAMGMIYGAVIVSSIVSGVFIGAVFDRTGSYRDAFAAFLVLMVMCAFAALSIRSPEILRERRQTNQAADLPSAESANIVARGSPR
jgi:MFS family permease